MSAEQNRTVVLITGANQGIGLALAKVYVKLPNHIVVGTARNPSSADELSAIGAKVVQLDVTSDDSAAELPQRLANLGIDRVNILINNAGIAHYEVKLGSPKLVQDVLEQFNTNVLGILRVTNALLPLLRKGASPTVQGKVVNISSILGSVTDNTTNIWFDLYGYRASKAAVNQISVSLARDLEKDNILALAVHPGVVSTRLNVRGQISPQESASGLVKVIEGANKLEDAFKLWSFDGTTIPW